MADQQNPYPQAQGGQGPDAPQSPQENSSKFRLGGLISSIVQGSSGRNIGLGQGLSYAADPNQRAIFNQTQQGQMAASGNDLARQRSLMQHLQQHPGLVDSNPEVAAMIAHAHEAGYKANQAGTEAGHAARMENQDVANTSRYAAETGEQPGFTSLIQGKEKGAAEVAAEQAKARVGAVTATGAENTMAATGTDPQQHQFEQDYRLRKAAMEGGPNTLGGKELAEKGREFNAGLPIEKARAMGGYAGLAAYMHPDEAGRGYEAAMQGLYPDLKFGPGGGMPMGKGGDANLEEEMREQQIRKQVMDELQKSGRLTNPSAPSTQGTGPGTSTTQWSPPWANGGSSGSPSFGPPPTASRSGLTPDDIDKIFQLSLKGGPHQPFYMPSADKEVLKQRLTTMAPDQARAMIRQLQGGH